MRLLIASAMIIITALNTAAQNLKFMEKTSGHAPVNGIAMYYEIYGNGEMPLVLIQGAVQLSRQFSAIYCLTSQQSIK